MTSIDRKHTTRSNDVNKFNGMKLIWMIYFLMKHDLYCCHSFNATISMENFYKSKTSRTMNFDTHIQSSTYIQNMRIVRTMDFITTISSIVSCNKNNKLFQYFRKIWKTLDIWTWNVIYKNRIHTYSRIR